MTYHEPTTAEEVRALARAVRQRWRPIEAPRVERVPKRIPAPPRPIREPARPHYEVKKMLDREERWQGRGHAILEAVCRVAQVRADEVTGLRRMKYLMVPRFVAVHLIVKHTGLTTPQVGKILNRDHTTILNACLVVGEKPEKHAALIAQVTAAYPHLFEPPRPVEAVERELIP
jgi:chromosomal replication initiation ATPase DnaA